MTTDAADATGAAYLEFLDRMPKVDLHVHLTGTVRAATFAELAARERLVLPADPYDIYTRVNSRAADLVIYANAVIPAPTGSGADEPDPSYGLFEVSQWVQRCLTTEDDLTRIAYEACQDAVRNSNVKHLEMSIDPLGDAHRDLGFAGALDAYVRGIEAAEQDFDVSARLLVAIDRSRPAEEAVARVQETVTHRRDHVVGIGLDNLETVGPPERFVAAYELAGRHGLRRTAHSSEHAPTARNTTTCLDLLGCDRIDHGYFVLQDDAVVERCREQQVPFTCIFTTSRRAWRPWRRASTKEMVARGLTVCLASDDPGMFPTTLSREYQIAGTDLGFDAATMRRLCLNAVSASWLDEPDRSALRKRFEVDLDDLEAELLTDPDDRRGRAYQVPNGAERGRDS